jgi:hypothetical protein
MQPVVSAGAAHLVCGDMQNAIHDGRISREFGHLAFHFGEVLEDRKSRKYSLMTRKKD